MSVFAMRKKTGHSAPVPPAVQWVEVTEAHEGQRLDNFLLRLCKGVPKSHLYKAVRSGEVRVNKGRCPVDYRLQLGDLVRVPPLRLGSATERSAPPQVFPVVFEDDSLIIIDKPAGVAVHGGSGVSHGVIESMRAARPGVAFLELVHRLDRDTSGLLMLAKRRAALVRLHQSLREGRVSKHYVALVEGRLDNDRQHVRASLTKWTTVSGERRVKVDPQGQVAHTIVTCLQRLPDYCLVDAELRTGRTHQIRVHLAWMGHPIVGDQKYGSDSTGVLFRQAGLNRMFLHAHRLSLPHPGTGQPLELEAPVPASFNQAIEWVSNK